MSDTYPWEQYPLHELEEKGVATLGRGNIISKIDIKNNPGGFPIYSSSAKGEGLFGTYGDYMFDDEMITWSVDGGGNLFYRPRHKFSVTNVSGYMRLDTSVLDYRFAHASLALQHSKLTFDYQTKAHPSVIRNLYHLPIPPLPEQKKIAEILSGIDKVIHRRRDLLEKVTLLASRTFNEVIDGIAKEHPIVTVESVTTKVIDGPHLTPNYQERGVPFATVKNITSGKLDLTNTKFITPEDHANFCKRGKAEQGDILYSKDGSIGHTCVVPGGYDFSFFVSVALLKTNKAITFPEYLNAVLQSSLVKTQTELMSEGSGLKHMVLRSIKALMIPLPPLDKQMELMAQLAPVIKSKETIEDTIQRMAHFREGIASDLLSGRKRVGEARVLEGVGI